MPPRSTHVLLLGWGLLACRPESQGAPPDPAEVQGEAGAGLATSDDARQPLAGAGTPCAEPSTSAPTTTEPASTEPGPAYLWTHDLGLFRVDDGGVRRVIEPLTQADRGHDSQLLVAPNGQVWLAKRDGVFVLDADATPRRIAEHPVYAYDDLTVDASGRAWTILASPMWSMERYDGSSWTSVWNQTELERGGSSEGWFVDLVVGDDALWLASSAGVWRGSCERWQPVASLPEARTIEALTIHRGRLLAGDREGWLEYGANAWQPLATWPSAAGVAAISEAGALAVPSSSMHVELRSLADERLRSRVGPLTGSEWRDLDIDAAGRTWVASDRELAVIATDGQLLARWPTGTLPGIEEAVEEIAVVGAGPTQLPTPTPGRTRTVVGRVVDHDTPSTGIARARVEVCSVHPHEEPCPRGSRLAKTTTAKDGSFRLVGIPDGSLHVVVDAGCARGQGAWLSTYSICTGANADPCDVGPLEQCLPPPPPDPP